MGKLYGFGLLAYLASFFLVSLLFKHADGQIGIEIGEEVEDVMEFVVNFTYPAYYRRCHKCVFESDISAYLVQAPVCYYNA